MARGRLRVAKVTEPRRASTVDAPRGWLNSTSAAAYLDFSTVRAFREWARRHGVPCAHRGRRVLYLPADLDTAIGAAHRGAR